MNWDLITPSNVPWPHSSHGHMAEDAALLLAAAAHLASDEAAPVPQGRWNDGWRPGLVNLQKTMENHGTSP